MGKLAVARIQDFIDSNQIHARIQVTDVPEGPLLPPGYFGSPTIHLAGLDLEPAVRGRQNTAYG
jgi:hypothetical protein